jgi:hypothetical protein
MRVVRHQVSPVEPQADDVGAELSETPEALRGLQLPASEERRGMNDARPIIGTRNEKVEDDERHDVSVSY